jgi:hypothetical protein
MPRSQTGSDPADDRRQVAAVFLLVLALVLGVVGIARAEEPVVFGDANLRVAVVSQLVAQDRIPEGSDGTTITASDLQTLTTLQAPDRGITTLNGLQDAANLKSLDLRGNGIATIAPLAGLTNLTDLDVSRNKLDLAADSPAMTAIAGLEALGVQVICQPQRAALSLPSVSASALTFGKAATFSAGIAPQGAAVEGTSHVRLYHLETKTVTKIVSGRSRKVTVTYWRLRATLSSVGTSAGRVSATAKLSCAGKWQARFTFAGSDDYEPCTSTVRAFVVRDPRIEAAIAWALHRRGAHAWDHLCLKFVGDAYQRGAHAVVTRYGTAKRAANALHASSHRSFNAPRGAYVFYDSWHGRSNLGHVGISLGGGMMVNAYGGKGVKVMPIRNSMHYLGWAAPPVSPRIVDWDTPPAS